MRATGSSNEGAPIGISGNPLPCLSPGRRRKVHNVLLRGWQLAGTGTARTGPPFTPMLNNANQNLGESIRPNRIATGTVPNPNPSRWFDVSAFPVVPDNSYAFGNSGRDILDAPGAIQINLALDRNFRCASRTRSNFGGRYSTHLTTRISLCRPTTSMRRTAPP